MLKPRILRSYNKLADGKLVEKAGFIINSMTANTSFATPDPTLVVVKTANDAFFALLNEAQKGDMNKIAKKNDAKTALILLLDDLAAYVTKTAKGNRTIMISSGFELSKEELESISLGEVEQYKISEGANPGELSSACSPVQGARSYNHQVTLDPVKSDSIWQSFPSTNASYIIKGLKSGQKYWCRIEAIGSNDQLSYSEPISRYVQ